MLEPLIKALRDEASGGAAMDLVAGISRFHRIQASPGYREAAQWCAQRLHEAGLEVEILSYPAHPGQAYWGCRMFQEWSCREATLHLVSPREERRRLCDFRANPMSVIQRSTSTPAGGLRGEVVIVDGADRPEAYERIDVRGRFVLFTGEAQQVYELAVVERGALGLVTDQMPELLPVRKAMDLPNATQYTSFWHNTAAHPPAVGFVLSPSEGARLRRLLERSSVNPDSAADPVVLEARVRASLYDGAIEVVSAVIPGAGPSGATRGDHEVVLLAHLCHPKPSANDNASGSGTLVETARALAALIASGRLPRPRRTIRFLLLPEITGTYAYLAESEDRCGRIVAALNLDMVGENQGLCGGPLQLEYPPLACPDFTADALAAVIETAADEARNFAGTADYALYHYLRTPFSGGSDHYILSDPTVGVPCPMLIQFPDRFYHTSADTLDKVDPEMLGRVAVISGTYLYFWASAGPRQAAWLADYMLGVFTRDVSREADLAVGRAVEPEAGPEPLERLSRRLAFLAERKALSLEALARTPLVTGAEPEFAEPKTEPGGTPAAAPCPVWLAALKDAVHEVARVQGERARLAIQHVSRYPSGDQDKRPSSVGTTDDAVVSGGAVTGSDHRVPCRVHRGPVNLSPYLRDLPEERRRHWRRFLRREARRLTFSAQLLYWIDGCRTLTEVTECLELETGFSDPELVGSYVALLEELGLIRWC